MKRFRRNPRVRLSCFFTGHIRIGYGLWWECDRCHREIKRPSYQAYHYGVRVTRSNGLFRRY